MASSLVSYSPSGKVGVKTFAVFGAGIVGSVLLAFVYQKLMTWIPFIILDALLVFGFALVLGLASAMAADVGHCRNPLLGGLLGAALGAIAWGATFYWAYRSALGEVAETMPDVDVATLAEQLTFGTYLEARIDAGWSLKGSAINGAFVYIIWAIEGISLIAAPAYLFYDRSKEAFCETHQKWHANDSLMIPGITASEVKPLIEAGDLEGVLALQAPVEFDDNVRISFERRYCDTCPDQSFLTVTAHTFTKNKKGELEEKKDVLAYQVALSPALADRYTARFVAAAGGVAASA